jgi:hypothetical protein
MASLQAKEEIMAILCDLKAADGMRQFVLVSKFESIRFINFQILIIRRCDEATALIDYFD